MIEVTGLGKYYGAVRAVDDMTFTVPPGRVTGFLGPNGAGKSTTMRMIVGLDRPSAGTVTVNGRAVRPDPPPAARGGGRAGGTRGARRPQCPQPPAVHGAEQRHRPAAGRRGAGDGRPGRRRDAAGGGVLAGHEPAPRAGGGAARRPTRPAVRRAGERSRSRGHPVDPHPAARPGRGGPDGIRLEPPHERDGPHRRPPHRDREGAPDRRRQHRRHHRRQHAELGAGPLAGDGPPGRAATRRRRGRADGRRPRIGPGDRARLCRRGRSGRPARHRGPRAHAAPGVARGRVHGADSRPRRLHPTRTA